MQRAHQKDILDPFEGYCCSVFSPSLFFADNELVVLYFILDGNNN